MAAKKYPKTKARDAAMALAVKLRSEGKTLAEIGFELNVTAQAARHILNRAKEAGWLDVIRDKEAQLLRTARQYDYFIEELRTAWEQSKARTEEEETEHETKNSLKARGEKVPKTVKGQSRMVKRYKGKLPRGDYATIAFEGMKGKREMLGLDAPKEMNIKTGVLSWDEVTKAAHSGQGLPELTQSGPPSYPDADEPDEYEGAEELDERNGKPT